MSIGSRHFILVGDDAVKISQRVTRDFYFNRKSVLKEYAGQIIDIANVYLSLENRLPKEIIKIDCMRLKVAKNGALDKIYYGEHLAYMANKISGKPKVISSGSLVNASAVFNHKKLKNKYERDLSQLHLKKILKIVFK